MLEEFVSEENRIKPAEVRITKKSRKKKKLLAKKWLRISSPSFKLEVEEGQDCSKFSESIKKTLRDNGVID